MREPWSPSAAHHLYTTHQTPQCMRDSKTVASPCPMGPLTLPFIPRHGGPLPHRLRLTVYLNQVDSTGVGMGLFMTRSRSVRYDRVPQEETAQVQQNTMFVAAECLLPLSLQDAPRDARNVMSPRNNFPSSLPPGPSALKKGP